MKKTQEQALLYYPYWEDNSICYTQCIEEKQEIMKHAYNGHDTKKTYIIDPLMVKNDDKGYTVPRFTVNSLDGIIHDYDADIEPELLNRLYIVLAKSCLNLVMKPIGVLADINPIKFLCFSSKQSEIIRKTFADYTGFDAQKPILLN